MGTSSRHHRGSRHSDKSRPRKASRSRRRHARDSSSSLDTSHTSSSDSELEASPFVQVYRSLDACQPSESVRQVDTVCGSHTYSLVGYTLARAMGPGTRLCSDLFEVGSQLFRIEVYPAGLSAATSKYVSVFLTTPGSVHPAHLLYELAVVDKSSTKPQHIVEARTAAPPCAGASGRGPSASPGAYHQAPLGTPLVVAAAAGPGSCQATVVAPQPGVVAGFPRFVKANHLHRNSRRYLQEDTLTIRATVKVLTGWSSFPVPPPVAQPQLYALQCSPQHVQQQQQQLMQRLGAPGALMPPPGVAGLSCGVVQFPVPGGPAAVFGSMPAAPYYQGQGHCPCGGVPQPAASLTGPLTGQAYSGSLAPQVTTWSPTQQLQQEQVQTQIAASLLPSQQTAAWQRLAMPYGGNGGAQGHGTPTFLASPGAAMQSMSPATW